VDAFRFGMRAAAPAAKVVAAAEGEVLTRTHVLVTPAPKT
jgi:hypothetical protein